MVLFKVGMIQKSHLYYFSVHVCTPDIAYIESNDQESCCSVLWICNTSEVVRSSFAPTELQHNNLIQVALG